MVKLVMAIREGWKATENERFGEVFELRWADEKTNKVLWRYAPKLEDEHIFNDCFAFLREYDAKLKGLRDIITRVEGRTYKGYGECGGDVE